MNKTEEVPLGSESSTYGKLENVLLDRAIQDEVAITFSEEEGECSRTKIDLTRGINMRLRQSLCGVCTIHRGGWDAQKVKDEQKEMKKFYN